MSDPNRPISRWSTSMSITTKSTAATNQTIPLINVRRKLFRQSANNKKTYAQRMAKTKHDIEELFKLYYSNDIKFDTFQRQIVTGTRIPTARQSPLTQVNLTNNSTNVFHSKHCVSREQITTTDLDCNETTAKFPSKKRTVQIRVENNSLINSSLSQTHSNVLLSPPILSNTSNQSITSPKLQQDELCDSSLIKSVTFLEDISNEAHENINTKTNKSSNLQRPKSSLLTVPPEAPPAPPSSLLQMNNNRKDPTTLSHTSLSTINSVQQQQQKNDPAIVTGSAVIVRQRSPSKHSWNRQRIKSNMTMATNESAIQSTTKTRSPSICSPLSIQPDMPELPVFIGSQRVVSIPSKCSRYVLVTFPETPLRYNAPSYVERLLLPERFPTLFQNIIQSYDHHLTSIQHHRNAK